MRPAPSSPLSQMSATSVPSPWKSRQGALLPRDDVYPSSSWAAKLRKSTSPPGECVARRRPELRNYGLESRLVEVSETMRKQIG